MTEDTRRALQIIEPIAEVLDIDIEATDRILRMDGQAIGISCNSTYATLMEMIGWLFLERYVKGFRDVDITQDGIDDIRRYWVKPDVLKKMGAEV